MPLPSPLPDVTDRRVAAELMDAPGVEPTLHDRALRALARVNALSFTAGRLWRVVRRLRREGAAPVRVLDLACGGGDVAVSLAVRARRAGIPVEIHACDRSAFAIDRARARAERARVVVRFFALDVVEGALPSGFDLVASSLFLHHLEAAQAVRLLSAMSRAGRVGVVQDLRRGRLGLALAWGALHLLTRSEIARVDGLRSVRAAFTADELGALARAAGLPSPEVTPIWPQRLLLHWRRAPGPVR